MASAPSRTKPTMAMRGATPKPATTPLPEFASNASPNNTEVNSEKNGPLPTPDNSVNVNDKVPGPKKKPVPAKSPEIKRSAPNPVFALFPGLVRSNGKTNELKLPEYSQGATFHLKIDATNYESYQAQITDADGNLIAEFNGLKSSKNGVKFFVKADKLSGGDYLIRLNGVSASGANESVADFQFRVK